MNYDQFAPEWKELIPQLAKLIQTATRMIELKSELLTLEIERMKTPRRSRLVKNEPSIFDRFWN